MEEKGEQSQQSGVSFDPHRTYGYVLASKEKQLAKDAMMERRTMQLTKRFIRMQEENTEAAKSKLHEASERDYAKMCNRVRHGKEAADLLREELRLEKEQIRNLVDKECQLRDDELRKCREREDEKAHFLKARQCFEAMEAERRRQNVNAEIQRRLDMQAERQQKNILAQKETMELRVEKDAALIAKQQLNTDKATERLRNEHKQRRMRDKEEIDKWSDRLSKATQAKEQAAEDLRRKGQEAQRLRENKVDRLRQKHDEEQLDKLRKLVARRGHKSERRNSLGGSATDDTGTEHERLNSAGHDLGASGPLGSRSAREHRGTAREPPKAEDAIQGGSSQLGAPTLGKGEPTQWVKDLEKMSVHVDVQRDYVQRCRDMEEAKRKMREKNVYKKLEEGASKDADADDLYTARLRAVHKKFGPKSAMSSTTAPSQESRKKVSEAKGKFAPCSLCEKEVLEKDLEMEPSALLQTVQRLRDQSPRSTRLRTRGGEAEPGQVNGIEKLRLCKTCRSFVRVMGT